MTDLELDPLIKKLVEATNQEEKAEAYKLWAKRYDKDLDSKGYIAPETCVALLQANQPDKTALVYDAGCGTGRVGVLMNQAGFQRLQGADFSPDMLKVAEASRCYQLLEFADYTQPIAYSDHYFDIAISVGVYSREFKGIFLKELVRVVKPGGCVVFSCRPYHYEGYAENDIEHLVQQEKATLISKRLDTYMQEDQSKAWYVALRVR